MSAYIPFELQTKITKKVPVKSILRFRTLSKRWKSLIDSSEFITDHSLNQTQPHQLLVMYKGNYVNEKFKFVLLVDDNGFPQWKLFPTVPSTIDLLMHKYMLDCSYGLVCLSGFRDEELNGLTVLWNPLIRKSVVIPTDYESELYVVGFGVCPKTSDPKIVKILGGRDCMELKAEVFRLSSRNWRSVPMTDLSYNSIEHISNQVIIDGAIYWVVFVKVAKNNSISIRLLSFDLTSEEFGEVSLPDNLVREVDISRDDLENIDLYLSKFKESLAVLNYRAGDDGKEVCDVWMMSKTGVPNPSFTKLFTVKGLEYHMIAGFRKTGEPILRPKYPAYSWVRELVVYGLSSERMNGLKIYGSYFQTTSYTESLLLLNHI